MPAGIIWRNLECVHNSSLSIYLSRSHHLVSCEYKYKIYFFLPFSSLFLVAGFFFFTFRCANIYTIYCIVAIASHNREVHTACVSAVGFVEQHYCKRVYRVYLVRIGGATVNSGHLCERNRSKQCEIRQLFPFASDARLAPNGHFKFNSVFVEQSKFNCSPLAIFFGL